MKEPRTLPALAALALFAAGGAVQAANTDTEVSQEKKCVVVVKVGQDGENVQAWTVDSRGGAVGIGDVVVEAGEHGDHQLVLCGKAGVAAPTVLSLVAMSEGDPSRGWLGVSLGQVSPPLAAQLGLEDEAVMIENVVKDSPAARAGLQRYDVVLAVDGEEFGGSVGDLAKRLGELGPDAAAELTVIRSGKEQTVAVQLGSRPDRGDIEWEHEWTGLSSVSEKLRTRGRILMRDEEGNIKIHELGDLKALKELPDSVRCLIPSIDDISTRIWVDTDKGSFKTHIKTRIEEDGQTIEIEQQDGGQITVRRTTVDEQGDSTTSESLYADAEALEAADQEAHEMYSRIQGPHVIDLDLDLSGLRGLSALHGLSGLNLNIDLEDLKKDQAQWRVELREGLEDAGQAYEEAMKSVEALKHYKFTPGRSALDFFVREPRGVQQSFSVDSKGHIEIRLRKGDSEVVMSYDSAEDLAKRNPEMYEKYSEVVNSPVEE